MDIIECTLKDVDSAAILFNAYRQFYEQPDDLKMCGDFLRSNIEMSRSRVFLGLGSTGNALAFAQLYPALCSVEMKPFFWLYDLYVAPEARKAGHARQLMNHLSALLKSEGAHRISLDTATSNRAAQALYESLGYERESHFITYHKFL
ncbi:GNAT family N-acetyltransferase [Pseudomonas sp. NPDC007930]|uniref:GNAT family N-acetyltransferase n=1 Tax=Pseudomonas sp. NPDC007930 TaxID=3364417 RepID=UPI0036EBC588